jgi:CheY-like chemotaxis protein
MVGREHKADDQPQGDANMSKSVLVVDDHAMIRRMVGSLFKSHGFDVSDAENGAQAVEKAQQVHPSLIVLDLAMPVMNGFEAARALKALMPQVPLLMFTNTVGTIMEQEARSAGIAAVISKSDSAYQLLERADALLN